MNAHDAILLEDAEDIKRHCERFDPECRRDGRGCVFLQNCRDMAYCGLFSRPEKWEIAGRECER